MYVLSLAGFFRFDDISRIRSDISFKEGFMVIKVFKSKNDQLRRGDEVVISQLSGSACLDELLKRYLAMFRTPLIQKMLFSSPYIHQLQEGTYLNLLDCCDKLYLNQDEVSSHLSLF